MAISPTYDGTTTEGWPNRLARLAQKNFPLTPRPFHALGQALERTEGEILDQFARWVHDGKLREISAVLEGAALGYDSALVAGRVPEDEIARVAEIINQHPTVTHNYRREYHYNLWFTIAVPKDAMDLEQTLELLAEETGVDRYYPLRRTKTFKIGVNFDMKSRKSRTSVREMKDPGTFRPDARQRRMFRALQRPLDLTERPFRKNAEWAGVGEDELLAFATEHMGGAVRKFVATFHHRRLGVLGNGMAVWRVPEEDEAEVGRALAEAPEVSHCYARVTIPDFHYSVYSMIHGPDHESVEEIAARLADEVDVHDYLLLFSTHEYKKCRLRYFLPELDAWWNARTEGRK